MTPLHRFTAIPLLIAAALGLPAAAGPSRERPEAALERQMLELINSARRERGLPALKADPVLADAALGHSREMAEKDYFRHRSPTPGRHDPVDRFLRAGGKLPQSYALAENIYRAGSADIPVAHRALMESAGHRGNLLDRNFQRAGVGIHVGPSGALWVTQVFLGVPEDKPASLPGVAVCGP